jgi:hypothetical protein
MSRRDWWIAIGIVILWLLVIVLLFSQPAPSFPNPNPIFY